MKRVIVSVLILVLLTGMMPVMTFAADGIERVFIYVSPDGDDGADGSMASPLATIVGARDRIRQLKSGGQYPSGGVVVYLRGGDYAVEETLDLTEEDSGTDTAPIVYRSYPGEKATLVGGYSMNAGDFVPATDSEIAKRVIDDTARSKLVSIDLTAQGFEDIGDLYLEGTGSYSKDFPPAPDARSPEIIIDGKIMTNSRYPNEGYMTISEVIYDEYHSSKNPAPELVYAGIEFKSEDTRYLMWDKADDAVLLGYWYYDWADQSLPIRKIDKEKGTVQTALSSTYGTNRGQRFFAYNLPEEIDVPGEYYIDRKTNILYLYPPRTFSENSNVRMSYFKNDLITVNGAKHIDIEDISFSAMRKSAITINSGEYITISGCDIGYSADYGVNIRGGYNCGVTDSYIHDVNGGVNLYGGVAEKLIPANNYVVNCEIERFSRLTKAYKAAVYGGGVGNRIAHNEIHDGPHLGIMFGGFDMIIENNEIYDVIKESDDMGAIYGGQTWLNRGLIIRGNYIHDLTTESKQSTGISGVYLDGAQCGVTIEGNIAENISGDAFKINGGRDNRIENNIAINCKSNVNLCFVPEEQFSYERRINTIIKSNIWSNPEDEPWKKEPFSTRFPEITTMIEDEPMLPKNNSMINNVSVNTEPIKYTDIKFDNPIKDEGNFATFKDPGFVNMMLRNYNLREDSAVYKEIPDFVPINFNEIGRYDKHALKKTEDAVILCMETPYAITDYQKTLIDKDNMKVVPVILDSRTYVPLRFVAEAFGMNVEYDNGNITLSSGETEVKLTIGDEKATVNGEQYIMEVHPFTTEGRTLVPLRAVSNLIGKDVFWDDRGFIAISDSDSLFESKRDEKLISYLMDCLDIY